MARPKQIKGTAPTRFLPCRKNTNRPRFPLFSKLATEIQLRIWLLSDAVAEPTTVFPSKTQTSDETNYKRDVPVILQVCQWTRGEFQSKDGKSKMHIAWTLLHGLNTSGGIYISLEHDEVVVAHAKTLSIVPLRKLHNLVLVENVAYKNGTFKPYQNHSRPQLQLRPKIAKFKNLSTLTLVFTDERFYAMFREKDGQIDAEGVWGEEDFLKYKNKILSLVTEYGEEHGDWKLPTLKLRTKGQFCAAKKIGWE